MRVATGARETDVSRILRQAFVGTFHKNRVNVDLLGEVLSQTTTKTNGIFRQGDDFVFGFFVALP